MTTERESSPERKFVPAYLPWLVAVGALAVYLVTLNRWVSFNSLPQVGRVSGWIWQPELSGPLFWLLTCPFRILPARLIPLALNLFAALCGALSLALLARSVALLPYDRTHQQRERERSPFSMLSIPAAWVPPALAALVCGLQLSFWENATVASADMLDLLVLAYAIRCLLEYRISDRESWLLRAALAYGLGMTTNWAMIGFFPAFVVALVWIRGLSFFNLRFLARMLMCGSIGLSLYFLLPLVASLGDTSSVSFWPALKHNLANQKLTLQSVYLFCNTYRQEGLFLALLSVVPLLSISIRWPSYFGDTSQLGVALTTFIFHLIHGLFLGILLWVTLNPTFTPYSKGYGPFLTYYYLGALTIGYCAGYFLLLFSGTSDRPRRVPFYLRLINSAVTTAVWLLLLTPVALFSRNLPQIRAANGALLKQYAALQAEALPARNAVLLADDLRRSLLLQAYTAENGKDYLVLDTASLAWPDYHRFLSKKYPQLWEVNPPKGFTQRIDPILLIELLSRLARTNSIYYLHPSFGYYFEFFRPESHGLVYKLTPYATNVLFAPNPDKDLIAENEAFWAKAGEQALGPLITAITPPKPRKERGLWDRLAEKAHLSKQVNRDATMLASLYSRALDYWGVEMQQSGRLTDAAAHFQRALDLNPANIVAQINLDCNRNLQAGRKSSVQISKAIEDELAKYRKWDDVIGENGPFDEPSFCFEQGRVFVSNHLSRQGAAEFNRVRTLAPDNLQACLWLGQLYVRTGRPSEALKLLDEIQGQPELLAAAQTNRAGVLLLGTSAHLAQGDLQRAVSTVDASLKQYPGDTNLLAAATRVYMDYGCFSNALGIIEQELAIAPANLDALVNKGCACIQIGAFEQAIPPLTQVLAVQATNYTALLNRAISYLRANNLEASRRDYEVLQKALPTAYQIYFGLGEIAWRNKDTNAAIKNYQLYLANAQTNTAEAKEVIERLRGLKTGSP